MKNVIGSFGFVLLMSLSSCSVNRVVTIYDSDTIANNPNYETVSWTYWWGLKQPNDINPECESEAMSQVEVKTTFGQAMLSFITLGVVVPKTVKWSCMPIDPPIDSLTWRSPVHLNRRNK